MAIFLKFKILMCFALFMTFLPSLQAQKKLPVGEDYKNWTLEELLFSIDSGLLDKEKQEIYLEFYLQKAKKSKSQTDIIAAYKKKIGNAKEYATKMYYADSLYIYGSKLQSRPIMGEAFYFKAYAELLNKNYRSALEYGLKAEKYLESLDSDYILYKVKNIVGNTYYHLEEYEKAYAIFAETARYHQHEKLDEYNNQMRHLLNLYSLSKTAYQLQKLDTLPVLIAQGYKKIRNLKSHHQPMENAYFHFVDGMYRYSLGQYKTSDSLLRLALPEMIKNKDFANEHLIYLFQGKNLWKEGKHSDAVIYFNRVDSLYRKKNFVNKELSEAYGYLIDYAEISKNPKLQLHYTNTLLNISEELQKNNKNLTNYLHANFDTKNLKDSKAKLESQLRQNENWTFFAYVLLAFLATAFGLFYLFHRRAQQNLKKKYEELVAQNSLSGVAITRQANSGQIPESNAKNYFPTDTQQLLLERLQSFEEKKEYLSKVTLDDLAIRLSTNRTTLSKLLNEQKGGFSSYINTLRVNNAIAKLSEPNSKLHLLTTDALAEEFGFGNPKSFSVAFKEIAGMPVSDFIKFSKQKV